MIYFMQPVDGGPVKIGFSDDVAKRHRELQGYYGRELTILGSIDGDRGVERIVHRNLFKFRLGREQFRPTAELRERIGLPVLVADDPEAVELMAPLKGVPVNLPIDVVNDATIIAALQRRTVPDVIGSLLREPLAQMRADEIAKEAAKGKSPR